MTSNTNGGLNLAAFGEDDDDDMNAFDLDDVDGITSLSGGTQNGSTLTLDAFDGFGDDDDDEENGFDLEGVGDFKLRNANKRNSEDHAEEEEEDAMAGFGESDSDDDFFSSNNGETELDFADASNFESDSKAEVTGIQIDETYRWLINIKVTETIRERKETYKSLVQLLQAIHTCPVTRGSISSGMGSQKNVRLEQLRTLLGLAKEGQDKMLREQLGVVPAESSLGPMYVFEMLSITHLPTRVKVLELISLLIETDPRTLQTFILIGILPEIIQISINSPDLRIKYRTAVICNFIITTKSVHEVVTDGEIVKGNQNEGNKVKVKISQSWETMKLFIACGGLPMLVDLLKLNYQAPKETTQEEQKEQKEQKEQEEQEEEKERSEQDSPIKRKSTNSRSFSFSRSSTGGSTATLDSSGSDNEEDEDEDEEHDDEEEEADQENAIDSRDIIHLAIDSSRTILELDEEASEINVHSNEMCRKFTQANMLHALVDTMNAIIATAGEQPTEWKYVQHLLKMLEKFVYKGDIKVKAHVVENRVMGQILKVIDTCHTISSKTNDGQVGMYEISRKKHNAANLVKQLVRIIGRLSKVNIYQQSQLQKQNVIPVLVSFLPNEKIATSNDLQNTAMLAIFDLCFLSPPRQEQAAVAGIVPKLINLLDTNIKNLSLKVFCDLAHAKSNICREQLGLHQGVAIYLKYMADRNRENRIKCFTSLSTWLMKDIDLNGNSIVEIELLKPNALNKLITLFQKEKINSSEFEAILKPMLNIISKSMLLNQALGKAPIFIQELSTRLISPNNKNNVVRLNLLKILKLIMEQHSDLKTLIEKFNLYPMINTLAKDNEMAAVSFLAGQLLELANKVVGGGVEGKV